MSSNIKQAKTQWYRAYSDKWLEQGSQTPCNTNTNITVTYLRPYSQWTPIITTSLDYGGFYMVECMGWRTLTSMVVRIYRPVSNDYNENLGIHWVVQGYGY